MRRQLEKHRRIIDAMDEGIKEKEITGVLSSVRVMNIKKMMDENQPEETEEEIG